MSTKREALDLLSLPELNELVARHGVAVSSRDEKEHLVERLDEKGPALHVLLFDLHAERLRAICRALRLDDGGRAKRQLIARIVGDDAPPPPPARLEPPAPPEAFKVAQILRAIRALPLADRRQLVATAIQEIADAERAEARPSERSPIGGPGGEP